MFKMKVKKINTRQRTYTLSKDESEYVLTDGQYTFRASNLSFMRSFVNRLHESGHSISVDACVLHEFTCGYTYNDPEAGCGGCVCNTGCECMLQKGADTDGI